MTAGAEKFIVAVMSESSRPNPDALLAALQKEEARRKRGTLKVFFGMAPGVGKTFAMLEAAQRELAGGPRCVNRVCGNAWPH